MQSTAGDATVQSLGKKQLKPPSAPSVTSKAGTSVHKGDVSGHGLSKKSMESLASFANRRAYQAKGTLFTIHIKQASILMFLNLSQFLYELIHSLFSLN